MNPLMGIFAAPAASSAIDLGRHVIETAAVPFAAVLDAAARCVEKSSDDGALEFLESSQPANDGFDGVLDLDGLFTALGL